VEFGNQSITLCVESQREQPCMQLAHKQSRNEADAIGEKAKVGTREAGEMPLLNSVVVRRCPSPRTPRLVTGNAADGSLLPKQCG
jgi:hypothetical protein